MSKTVIQVENLSKKYVINHQEGKGAGNRSLRESISNGLTSLGKKFFTYSSKENDGSTREDFWALKDISFEIKQGDRVGIIGRNGAGKSTLLKILSRITEPTNGRIAIQGRVASLLEVGTGFHPELTGRENVYLNGAILGMSKVEIQRKFDEIVAFAEIDKFIDTPVKRYSSGMYVRLAFSVAAHLEPEVLIVDEVLAVGDSNFQKKCLGKMENVSNEGRTILFVSHTMEAIARLCNNAILLKNGLIQFSGSSDKAINLYLGAELGTTARRKWDDISRAPGNEIVRLIEVNVHEADGRVTESFDITKPIGITIIYRALKDSSVFTHSMNLFNANGAHILSSHDVVSELRTKPRSIGHYSSTMWIPSNFLAEGSVFVSVAIIEQDPFIIHFHELEVVSFNVFDHVDGNSARGEYVLGFPGIVRPLLNWETARISLSEGLR
jgi:lipopolysaccharide transport system ATP-binding protein